MKHQLQVFHFLKFCTLLILSMALSSCGNSGENNMLAYNNKSDIEYAFFTAGHTYGHPEHYQYGLHPPFARHIPFFNAYPAMELGILTGDVVPFSTPAYWDSAAVDIDQFTMPIHIAAGNHDRGPTFEERYPSYYTFRIYDDLFIILSPTNWNIEGDQKKFLVETLDNQSDTSDHIFLFVHELIWWAPDNMFRNININYTGHYPGSTNYWSEVSPILESLSNEVVIFAGDLGAHESATPYMFHRYQNITLIAHGMGGGKQDNVLITEVGTDGALHFRLLGIQGESPTELADLEAYELP